METLLPLIGTLKTGHITLLVISLIVLLVIAKYLEQGANLFVKTLLAFDSKDAPEFKGTDYLNNLLCKLFIVKKKPVYFEGKGWAIRNTPFTYYDKTNPSYTNWSRENINFCTEPSEKEIEDRISSLYGENALFCLNWKLIIISLVIDAGLLLFTYLPTLTLTLGGFGIFYWGVRTLAQKVWSNSSRISIVETKIDNITKD